jgi:hypothetical protein
MPIILRKASLVFTVICGICVCLASQSVLWGLAAVAALNSITLMMEGLATEEKKK